MAKLWTQEEIDLMIKYYPSGGPGKVLEEMKKRGYFRKRKSISLKWYKYKLDKPYAHNDDNKIHRYLMVPEIITRPVFPF